MIEPFDLKNGNETFYQMAQYSVQERYKFARFMYTCLFAANQAGTTCFDPLLFHYPSVEMAYKDIESTFIVGDAIKVSPVLKSLKEGEKI